MVASTKTKRPPLTKSEQMARVRSRDTQAEIRLRKALWASGLRYRLHTRLPGSPDIAFTRQRVAVFVDGCFWHGCPIHYTPPVRNGDFWRQKLVRNTARDRADEENLAALGWRVMRFWEHEVRDDVGSVVKSILDLLSPEGECRKDK